MQLIAKFALIFAFLVSAAFGAQSGSMATHHGTVGFSAEEAHSPSDMEISAIPGSGEDDHCPKTDGKSANHDLEECCAASCNAFEVTEPSSMISARSYTPMDISWTVTSAEGIQLESPYRPPEA